MEYINKTSATTKWAGWLRREVRGIDESILNKVRKAPTATDARAIAEAHRNVANAFRVSVSKSDIKS